MIDEKQLIIMIEDHKNLVTCDNKHMNEVYGMAHDHIIELVKILARKGGE